MFCICHKWPTAGWNSTGDACLKTLINDDDGLSTGEEVDQKADMWRGN